MNHVDFPPPLRTAIAACFTVVSTLVLAVGIVPGPASAEARDDTDNLIQNPGFETPTPWQSDPPRPQHWLVHANHPLYLDAAEEGVETEVDTHKGQRSVRLQHPRDWSDRWAATNRARVPVDGNDEFTFAAWVKIDGFDSQEFVQLRVEQFDAEGTLLPVKPFQAGPKERPSPGRWTRIVWDFKARPDARMIRPLLVLCHGGNEQSTAVATFDDISLARR